MPDPFVFPALRRQDGFYCLPLSNYAILTIGAAKAVGRLPSFQREI